jgi:glycosyltransferase involved in cell wall biosynthesis
MHVMILTTSNSASGGVRQALYLADGLNKLGHTVHFVCPPGGEAGQIIKEMKLPHIALPGSLFQAEKALRAVMPKDKPAILHGFHKGVRLAAYLGTYWYLSGLPVACVAHRGVTSRPRNPLPYLLPGIRAYLVNSQACAETLPLLWRKDRCYIVNNSVPEERILPLRSQQEMRVALNIPEGCRIIGNVSKGVGQAMKAFALSRKSLPPSKLVIVGVIPEQWHPLREQLNIAQDVILVPRVRHIADYMQLMDILVFPSSFIESQPNVVIEAMSMGIPVIAGDVGGIREILPPECLFDPKNACEISAKLTAMMRNPDVLKKLSAANAAQKHKFSTEYRLQAVLEYYQRVLNEVSPEEESAYRRVTP